MAKFDKAGVSLELDTSDFDSGYKSVLADAGKLDALDPTVKVSVNDADLKTAIDLVGDLDTSTSLKVNVDDTELTNASDQLDNIATIGAIDLAINIAGTAKGLFESAGRFSGVAGLLEMDSALALVQARTGKMIPDAEKLINDLYVNGWGESKTQIAGLVAQAAQLGLEGADLEAAVLSTLQVVSVTGGDATETLNKLDTASKANGRTFTETADLYIAGFQNGNDKADDLLDTMSEYGTTFANFRLSAEGAMAFLNSGLDNGVFNSDVLADSVRELGIRLASIGTDENVTKAFTDLDALSDIDLAGLLDGYKAGKVTGDEMLQGVIDALGDVAAVDPAQATTLGASLVGTQLEDMGINVFTMLSTDADTAFGEIEGRAETAGNTISNTLGVTVDTFLRGVEQMATDWLSSDAVDLDGKIETFKTQLQTAMSTLAEGGSLGDALEIGFGLEGVDTVLGNIERVFGQMLISILEAVAFIQDPTGLGTGDDATRRQISTLATQQLPFDLQLANSEEIPGIIDQAFARGVTFEGIGAAARTSIEEAFAGGDFGQGLNIIDGLMASAERNGPEAVATMTAFASQFTADLDTAFNEAFASGDFDIAKKISDAQGDPTAYTDALKGKFGFDAASFDALAAEFTTGMETAIAAETPTPDMAWADLWTVPPEVTTSITGFETDVETAMTNANLVTALASQEMINALSAMSDGVVTADEEIAYAITGNTMTTSFETMASSAEQNVEATKSSFKGLLATVSQVDVAMSAFFNGIMAKVGAVNSAIEGIGTVPTGGGGGGTVNNTSVVVNQTNNVQGNAQATAAGYQLAETVRGMG